MCAANHSDSRSAFGQPLVCSADPPTLRRLYIAHDADVAGNTALATLTERAVASGFEVHALSPQTGDFNEDLQTFGLNALRATLRMQLTPQDKNRFMHQTVGHSSDRHIGILKHRTGV